MQKFCLLVWMRACSPIECIEFMCLTNNPINCWGPIQYQHIIKLVVYSYYIWYIPSHDRSHHKFTTHNPTVCTAHKPFTLLIISQYSACICLTRSLSCRLSISISLALTFHTSNACHRTRVYIGCPFRWSV